MGEPTAPEMRATWMKLVLYHARRLPEAEARRFREVVGVPLWTEIREASVVAWLPAAHYARLCEASVIALGTGGARSLWCAALHDGLDRPLMRPLVSGAQALYGHGPDAIIRMSPRAWGLVGRHAGEVQVERFAEPRCRVRFDKLPPEFRRTPAVIEVAFYGNCEAVLRYTRVTGKISVDLSTLQRGCAALDVSWGVHSVRPPPA